MRISDVLSIFDSDVRFVRMNDRPLDVQRYSGLSDERWVESPEKPWVAVTLTANAEGEVGIGWGSSFDMYREFKAKPEAMVFILVGDLEQIPITAILRRAEECHLQFIAAFPLRYDIAKAAFVAVPTEVPIATNRWLAQGDPLTTPNTSTARRVYSQHVLSDAVRRAQQQSYGRQRAWSDVVHRSLEESRVQFTEREARTRERQLRAGFTTEVQALQARLAAAEELFRAVKVSSAYRLGNLLGKSARNPLWAIVGFPRELFRIVRNRSKAAVQATRAQEAIQVADQHTAASVEPRIAQQVFEIKQTSRLSIPFSGSQEGSVDAVAYVSHPIFGGIRRSAWQFDVLPNNWDQQLEMRVPAAICIDASASLFGSAWSGAGNGVDPTKGVLLVDVIRFANRFGIPCLFRWDVPAHAAPALNRVALTCDLVLTTDPAHLDSEVPVVPHGVAIDVWLPRADLEPTRSLAVIDNTDLLDRQGTNHTGVPRLMDLSRNWTRIPVSPGLVHRPVALKEVFAHAGIAVFPALRALDLPVLEALASGLPVIGFRSKAFAQLHHPSDVKWTDDDLLAIQEHAHTNAMNAAWSIRSGFSTIHETRSFGRLVSNPSMQSVGTLTTIVGTDESDPTGSVESFVDIISAMIEQIVVVSMPDAVAKAGRVATMAESAGMTAWVAQSWSEGARLAKRITPPTGAIWLASPQALGGSADQALKRTLISCATDDQDSHHHSFMSAQRLLAMSDEEAGTVLARMFEHPVAT